MDSERKNRYCCSSRRERLYDAYEFCRPIYNSKCGAKFQTVKKLYGNEETDLNKIIMMKCSAGTLWNAIFYTVSKSDNSKLIWNNISYLDFGPSMTEFFIANGTGIQNAVKFSSALVNACLDKPLSKFSYTPQISKESFMDAFPILFPTLTLSVNTTNL